MGTIPLDATGGMVAASAIFLVGIPGLATTIVGFSMNSTNKKRVELINSLRNTAFNDIKVNLQPCTQYNLMTQKYQPGLSLRINF